MYKNRYFYEKCSNAIEQAFETEGRILIEALPALGKSTGIIKTIAKTGRQAIIFTERHDLYDQLKKECEKRGLSYKVLPSFHLHCPTAGKEAVRQYGDEWADRFSEAYKEGYSARYLHDHAHEVFGEELPCQEEGICSFESRLDTEWEGFDVLIGHYNHMFHGAYSESRDVIIDEFPGDSVLASLSSGRVKKEIHRYLTTETNLPFTTDKEILEYRLNSSLNGGEHEPEVKEWLHRWETKNFEAVGERLKNRSTRNTAYAPLLVRVALQSRQIKGGWSRTKLNDGTIIVESPVGEVDILRPLPFDENARIIALDGTPSLEMWRAVLGDGLKHIPVLDETEKCEWLGRLGLRIIQLTDTPVPVLGGRNDAKTDYALIEEVARRESKVPFVVTSKNGFNHLSSFDSDGLTWEGEHYGNLKGTNELDGHNPVLIIGSPQQSDLVIQKWAAIRAQSATRATDDAGNVLRGTDLDFGPVGNDILQGIRENEVLQAAMRFSRGIREDEIRVYVYSSAIPEWVQPEVWETSIDHWATAKGITQVVRALKHGDDWQSVRRTTKQIEAIVEELYGHDGIRYHQIMKYLHRLCDFGKIGCQREGRNYVWWNIELERLGKESIVLMKE